MSIEVQSLHTYPVKSCAGVAVAEAAITPNGLEHDRSYMLVDHRGVLVSQRQVPEMVLVVPALGEQAITLTAPGMEAIEVPIEVEPEDSKLVLADVHGDRVWGQTVSDELNQWFMDALPMHNKAATYSLLKVRDDKPRPIAPLYHKPGATNQTGFADAHSILIASLASLEELNTLLDEPKPIGRFRPNIVIDGEGLEPYDEDYWLQIKVGNLSAFVVKACDRCNITDIDPQTAEVGQDVRRALVSRKGINAYDEKNKGVFFAQNLNHIYVPGVSIAVGQTVEVIERNQQPNFVLRNNSSG